jgi:hypothetical protein
MKWLRFYSRFKSRDIKNLDNVEGFYDLEKVLIGLCLLTNDPIDVKAEIIFDTLVAEK